MRTNVRDKDFVEAADKYKYSCHSISLNVPDDVGAMGLFSAEAELAQCAGVSGDVD